MLGNGHHHASGAKSRSVRLPRKAPYLLLLLLGELLVRHALGLFGIFNPEQGPFIQTTLIIWGFLAAALLIPVLLRESAAVMTPIALAVVLLGVSVFVRIPTTLPGDEVLATGVTSWMRLTLPLLATALFIFHLPGMIERAQVWLKSQRVQRLIISLAFLSALVLVYRLYGGYAWAWSPQQPLPYIVLAAFGAGGHLTLPRYGVLGALDLLSLKRSAMFAFVAFVLLASSLRIRLSRRAVSRGLVAIALGGVLAIAFVGTDVVTTLQDRVASAVPGVEAAITGSADSMPTVGTRLQENSVVFAAWTENASSLLFGAPLRQHTRAEGAYVTVHNSLLSLAHLGGLVYLAILGGMALSLRRRVAHRLSRRTHRWYVAAAVAGLVEGLAGNALLTLTFSASLAILFLPTSVVHATTEAAPPPARPHVR